MLDKMVYTYKKIIDSDGIEYEEVDYQTYLNCKNRHRIIQHLESRYFIEVNKTKVEEDWIHLNFKLKYKMKCPICNRDMEEIGNLKQAKIYFCRGCNDNQMKKNLKTRMIWMDDGTSLVEHKLIEGIKFR